MFPLLNHLFIHEIRITLLNQFSNFQAHTYLQWDNSATVTFLWYAFSQNTYLFHRHCGRHSISRNRMSEVTEALGVGKDCPLQKGTIKKNDDFQLMKGLGSLIPAQNNSHTSDFIPVIELRSPIQHHLYKICYCTSKYYQRFIESIGIITILICLFYLFFSMIQFDEKTVAEKSAGWHPWNLHSIKQWSLRHQVIVLLSWGW